jgi:hypothetical protein
MQAGSSLHAPRRHPQRNPVRTCIAAGQRTTACCLCILTHAPVPPPSSLRTAGWTNAGAARCAEHGNGRRRPPGVLIPMRELPARLAELTRPRQWSSAIMAYAAIMRPATWKRRGLAMSSIRAWAWADEVDPHATLLISKTDPSCTKPCSRPGAGPAAPPWANLSDVFRDARLTMRNMLLPGPPAPARKGRCKAAPVCCPM